MNPMEKKKFAGYILILVAIGIFAGSMVLSFINYRFMFAFPQDLADKISRSIFFVGLIMALITLCIGLFLIIKYRYG